MFPFLCSLLIRKCFRHFYDDKKSLHPPFLHSGVAKKQGLSICINMNGHFDKTLSLPSTLSHLSIYIYLSQILFFFIILSFKLEKVLFPEKLRHTFTSFKNFLSFHNFSFYFLFVCVFVCVCSVHITRTYIETILTDWTRLK